MRTDDVWAVLQEPGHGPVRRELGATEAEAEVVAAAVTPEPWTGPAAEADPFEHYVPPRLLPLDDVSLGHTETLEGTGWIEAGNPLGGYMRSGPLGVSQAWLARGGSEFRRLDILGGPGQHELTRSERRVLETRGRWAFRLFLLAAVACLVAAAIAVVTPAPGSGTGAVAADRATEGRTTLLLQRDGASLTAVTLFVSSPVGGKVLFVPPGIRTEVPGKGTATLAAAGEDPDLAAATVSNLLGLRVDHWIVTDSFGLQQLFGQVGDLHVDVPADLVALRSAVRADGAADPALLTQSYNFPAGSHDLTPEQAVAYLNAITKDGELSRLARHADVWEAFLGSLQSDPERAKRVLAANRQMVSDDPAVVEAAGTFAELAAAESVRFTVLPVTVTAGTGAGGEEFRLDEPTARLVYGELPENVVFGGSGVTRVGVATGPGTAAATLGRLLRPVTPGRYRIVMTSVAANAYDETLIVYYKDSQKRAAEVLRDSLGTGRVVWDPRDQDVVDLTVVVGADAATAVVPAPSVEQQPVTDQPSDTTAIGP